MKTKLAILLAVGIFTGGMVGLAQTKSKSEPKPKGSPPAAAKAAEKPAAVAAGELADVSFDGATLESAISQLAAMAGLNIIFDQKVFAAKEGQPPAQPAVSLRWEKVAPRDALDELLANYDLQALENPKTGITRITVKDHKSLEPLVTEIFQLNYVATNVVQLVTATFEVKKRSQVLVNDRTGQMIVVATAKEMENVKKMVLLLDVQPRQVLIEARLLETSMNPQSIRGIDWAGTLQNQNFGYGNGNTTGTSTLTTPGATTSTSTTLPGGRTITTTGAGAATQSTILTTLMGSAGVTANTLGGWSPNLAILNADGVRGVLSFLSSQAETEVLATPRAVTLDNQEAKLSVTRAFPIFQQSPGSAQVPATTQLIYTNIGTILTVLPRIAANSNITMKVSPEVSNIDSKDRQTIDGRINEANVYATRKIETQVMIPSGNTLVMGGLISDTLTKSYSKVPVLGDVPALGLLFRRDSKNRSKQNLVIFITPTIVADYDFQYTSTDFLRNKYEEKPEVEPSFMDTGKPKNWGRSGAGKTEKSGKSEK